MAKALQQTLRRFISFAAHKKFGGHLWQNMQCRSIHLYQDKDPAPYFFNERIQNLLKSLTGSDMGKVFLGIDIETSERRHDYRLMTDKQLEKYKKKADIQKEVKLQMPPVVKVREEIDVVLSRDPLLRHSLTDRMIFTDISYGLSDRERLIVVREKDGTLRKAHWEERERMNQVYAPQKGKKLRMPKVFEDENFADLLERLEYRFILDFACLQYEPDDPFFQQVTAKVYEDVDFKSQYDKLHSTRFYGPLCFYFVWNLKMDNLLLYYLHTQRMDAAEDLVNLHYLIHNPEKIKETPQLSGLDLIKTYIQEDSQAKPILSNALLALENSSESQLEKEEEI